MSQIVKAAVQALIEIIFAIVHDKTLNDTQKAERLKRATLALASEQTSEALIAEALKL